MVLEATIVKINEKIAALEKEKIRSAEVQAKQAQGFKVTGVNFSQGNLNRQIQKLINQREELIRNPPQEQEIQMIDVQPQAETKQESNFLRNLIIVGIVGGILLG